MEIYNFTALGNSRYLASHPHTKSGDYYRAEDVAKLLTTIKQLTELKVALTQINLILDRAEAELEQKRQMKITEFFAERKERRGQPLTKEMLEDMYISLRMTEKEIADRLGTYPEHVRYWIHQHGIKK